MTIRDTALVFSILTAAYPYFYRDIRNDEDQMQAAISVWHEMFAEYDIVTVKVALKRLIAIQGDYPPTIGQLLESINIVSGNAAPDADEVWGEITNAIGNYGYNRAIEAIDSLSEFARQAVKAFGWGTLCKSENIETDRAHFLRIYKAIKTRNDHKYILPNDVKAFIAAHDKRASSISGDKPGYLSYNKTVCQQLGNPSDIQTAEEPCGANLCKNNVESLLARLKARQMAGHVQA